MWASKYMELTHYVKSRINLICYYKSICKLGARVSIWMGDVDGARHGLMIGKSAKTGARSTLCQQWII